MPTDLRCIDCDSVTVTDAVEFDDLPILEWWAGKGERCAKCRRALEVARHRKRARVSRPHTTAGRGDSGTQLRGAAVGLPASGTRRRQVYDVLLAAGELGLTFEEIGELLGRSYSVLGPRVRELKRDGLVEAAGYQRVGASGAAQDVWRVRQEARV